MKIQNTTFSAIALATAAMTSGARAADPAFLDEVVVTATPMSAPLFIETDPAIPRQPLPAHDGADYLKTIPGFTVMRKGGTDGEPVFRGMAGSRLNIMVDEQSLAGACPGRMDAPTAYVFPEAYDRMTVIKGPQTVQYPNMGSAATIRFDREPRTYTGPARSFMGSVLGASFGRHDEIVRGEAGDVGYYLQAGANNSQSGDYEDGNGRAIHSRYRRWSANAAVGLTPDRDTRFELAATRSDGYAAYADRMMDGTRFDRENFTFKAEKANLSPLLSKLSFQLGHNSIDHVMDNYSLRTGAMMRMSSRVGITSTQARLTVRLALAPDLAAVVGANWSDSQHGRDLMSNGIVTDDARIGNAGVFGELSKTLSPTLKSVSGVRIDAWSADDQRSASSTAGRSRSERTYAGFTRLEQTVATGTVAYAGIGHTQRFPDYWELFSMSSANAPASGASALNTVRTEKTTQADAGMLYRRGPVDVSVSAFLNRINDFVLIDYNQLATGVTGIATNVDAQTYGTELAASYRVNDVLRLTSGIAYVRGTDTTNDRPLAQLPPLEARLGFAIDHPRWLAGGVLRVVAAQERYHAGFGNIAGKDLGPAAGFGTVSLNAGYRPTKNSLILFGVDNLFDKDYAEFISRSGMTSIGGYVPTMRVNEPGRVLWLKASLAFD